MSEGFMIKARLRHLQVEIEVREDMTIRQIKDVIEARLRISVSEQRLISQGKLLRDSETVQNARLQPGFVLQVMQRPPSVPSPVATGDSDRRPDPFLSLQTLLNGLPPAFLFDRSLRQRPRRVVPLVFKLESIRQNLITVENLIETRASPWSQTQAEELFNFTRRKLELGQWVDVKDTVDVWLEAQILDIRQNDCSTEMLVHYNEWPQQWDEWVDVASRRIQPFRMYSKQHQDSPVQSPFPVVVSPEVFRHHSTLLDVSDYIHQLATLIESMQPLFRRYFRFPEGEDLSENEYESDFEEASDCEEEVPKISNEKAKLKLGQQLGVIMDRLGRALSDLSFFVEMGASSISFNPARVSVMPTLSESRVTDQETEIRIHAIFAPPRRR